MIDNNNLKIEKDGYIRWVIFNRPDKRNSMNMDMFSRLREVFPEFNEDPEVRVVVVRGEGKNFTGGLDVSDAGDLFGGISADARELFRIKILEGQQSMNAIEKCRKPVIAAVHGSCVGAGVDLISACDIRLGSKDAIFSVRETKMGIIADLGTLQRLRTIVGEGWFRELALTGKDFSATEAFEMGLITHLCEDQEDLYARAKSIAEEIAANSPLTVQGVKDVMLFSRDNGVYPGLEYVAQKNAALVPSEDLMEAIRAFIEKRPPEFKGK